MDNRERQVVNQEFSIRNPTKGLDYLTGPFVDSLAAGQSLAWDMSEEFCRIPGI